MSKRTLYAPRSYRRGRLINRKTMYRNIGLLMLLPICLAITNIPAVKNKLARSEPSTGTLCYAESEQLQNTEASN